MTRPYGLQQVGKEAYSTEGILLKRAAASREKLRGIFVGKSCGIWKYLWYNGVSEEAFGFVLGFFAVIPGSSMVEQEAVNFEVTGSSPVRGAMVWFLM